MEVDKEMEEEKVTLDENDGSFESFVLMITNSSKLTQRGETSMMGQTVASPPSATESPGALGSSGSWAPA